MNYAISLIDLGIAITICGAAASIVTGDVYSEAEQRWARRRVLFYPPGNAELLHHLLAGTAGPESELPQRLESPGTEPVTALLLEFAPKSHTGIIAPDDTVYLSIAERTSADSVGLGVLSGGPALQLRFSVAEVTHVLGPDAAKPNPEA